MRAKSPPPPVRCGCARRAPRTSRSWFALFTADRAAAFRAAGLGEAELATLARIPAPGPEPRLPQPFPDARFLVVELDGRPVARLVEQDEADAVYVVDIAVVAERRRQGLARALVQDLQAGGARRGRGLRAQVYPDNAASLNLFRGLGFAEADAGVQVEFIWRP